MTSRDWDLWLNPSWEPSSHWDLVDRVEVVTALIELVERDVYAGRYSVPGRPNFTSIRHVLSEPAPILERARESVLAMLHMARAERAGRAQVPGNLS